MRSEKSLYELDPKQIDKVKRNIAGGDEGFAKYIESLKDEPTKALIETVVREFPSSKNAIDAKPPPQAIED